MRIQLKKFGTTLISRQAGREALAAFQPTLRDVKPGERVEIDFDGVMTLTPSWADEFLSHLAERFQEQLVLLPSENLSVEATIKLLMQMERLKVSTR